LVLSKDSSEIDVARTQKLFAAPTPNLWQESISKGPERRRFNPIGAYMGFIRYRGLIYTTTFEAAAPLDMDALRENKPRWKNALTVLLGQPEGMKSMCQYQMSIRIRH
jgi:hypothetical protein